VRLICHGRNCIPQSLDLFVKENDRIKGLIPGARGDIVLGQNRQEAFQLLLAGGMRRAIASHNRNVLNQVQ
jgi:hypothetical protein